MTDSFLIFFPFVCAGLFAGLVQKQQFSCFTFDQQCLVNVNGKILFPSKQCF